MFGKPEWFKEKSQGWGIHPKCWQGWVYAAVWLCAISIPFLILVARHQGPEALVWMAATVCLLLWDVTLIRRSMQSGGSQRDVLYISEDGECQEQLATENFRFQLRK